MATLKQALSEAENSAPAEHTEREKQEARVEEVQKELQALMKKHESLELDSKMQASELVAALKSVKSAKAEDQKALKEIDTMKKIAAGKAFIMQKQARESELFVTYPSPKLSRRIRRFAP